ncbi:MAG: hypothetical protein L0323_22100 [Planctomycetes bacterium]|nr:hypothetical protein [Planctomycetota bacterium]
MGIRSVVRAAIVLGLGVAGRAGQEATVGSIGTPDASAGEFAIAREWGKFRGAFPEGVRFRIGTSDPARDWPYIHPGPTDAWAGSARHPFRIEFESRETAEDLVILLDLVATHASAPPRVRVALNEIGEEREPQPGPGDGALADPRTERPRREEFSFPGSLLRAGTNEIEISVERGSWMIYDAVALLRRPAPAGGPLRGFRLEATPLVDVSGRRILLAAVEWRAAPAPARARGKVGAAPFEVDLGTLAFGRSRVDVPVPEVAGRSRVECALEVGGERREAALDLAPARPWTLYLGAHCHTDIGYTHHQTEAIAVHRRNVDAALDSKDPDFVWNLEVAFQARDYLRRSTPERAKRLVEALKSGRIGFHVAYLNLLSGLCTDEALARACLWGGRFARATGIPGDLATVTDVPSLCAAWPSVLAASGVRHFAHGINQTRAPMLGGSPLSETPFWWEGPDGARVLAWLSDGYAWGFRLGMTEDRDAMRKPLLEYLARREAEGYPWDEVLLFGGVYDNREGEIEKTAAAVRGWNERWKVPRVVAASESAFFREVERKAGDRLPVVRGSGGAYWEDGVGTTAATTALNRATHARLAAAETLLAASSLLAAGSTPIRSLESGQPDEPGAPLERAFEDLLFYDEHTWGAHSSATSPYDPFVEEQWETKREFARDGAARAARLLEEGRERLASAIAGGGGTEVLVLNALAFERTDLVRAEVPRAVLGGSIGAKVIDVETGEESPAQLADSIAGDTVPIEFVAKGVPPVGWRVYRVEGTREAPDAANLGEGTIENGRWRVALDGKTGAVASATDLGSGREWRAQQADLFLGEAIWVSGGEGTRAVWQDAPRAPAFEFHRPKFERFLEPRKGPVSCSVRSFAKARRLPRIVLGVTLYRDLPRLDLSIELTKDETLEKESVLVAFPFAAEGLDRSRLAEPLGVLDPAKGLLPGACVDWFAAQEFVRFAGPRAGVTWTSLDAPLLFLDGMHVGEWRSVEKFAPRPDGLVSWALNNYWATNYRASQGGEFLFRYSISADAGGGGGWEEDASALRSGRAALIPLEAAVRTGPPTPGGGRSPVGSLLAVEPAAIFLNALKFAEDGGGLVARLRNLSNRPLEARLRLLRSTGRRLLASDLVESRGEALARDGDAWVVPLRARGFATVRIE